MMDCHGPGLPYSCLHKTSTNSLMEVISHFYHLSQIWLKGVGGKQPPWEQLSSDWRANCQVDGGRSGWHSAKGSGPPICHQKIRSEECMSFSICIYKSILCSVRLCYTSLLVTNLDQNCQCSSRSTGDLASRRCFTLYFCNPTNIPLLIEMVSESDVAGWQTMARL